MRIDTYEACDPDAPPKRRFIAYLVVPDKGHWEVLPVYFTGATQEQARERAQGHWDKYATKKAPPDKKRSKAPKAAPEPQAPASADDIEEGV